jgi:hypothetical protein
VSTSSTIIFLSYPQALYPGFNSKGIAIYTNCVNQDDYRWDGKDGSALLTLVVLPQRDVLRQQLK